MAKKMLSLTQGALDELEALSANDTHKYNESSVVEALIHQAYAARADHLKRTEPVFETIGKRKKLIGFDASYNGFIIGRFDDREAARVALDAYVYEELEAA